MTEDRRKQYQKPQLKAWGAVRELTQTAGTGGSVLYEEESTGHVHNDWCRYFYPFGH